MKWTIEQKKRVYELGQEGYSGPEIVDQMQRETGQTLALRTVQTYMNKEVQDPMDLPSQSSQPNTNNDHSQVINTLCPDGSQLNSLYIDMTADQIKDPQAVMMAHGYDPELWEIINATNNLYQQNSKDDGMTNLYQSKIKVRPKVDTDIDAFKDAFSKHIKPVKLDIKQVNNRTNNLVIPLADIHFGITRLDDLKSYLADFQDRLRHGYNTVVIENIGDYLHSDQINTAQTVSGTQLDDVDMVTAIDEGMQFMEALIEMALQNAKKVEVKYVGGNHDFDSDYMFMYALTQRYRGLERVTIDLNNKYRSAYMLGHVLLSIQHGDTAKKDNALRLATEHKDMWGECTAAEIHSGHLHTELTKDAGGVVLRQFGTPKKADPYEIKNGYTTNKHELYALEYSDTKLVAEYHI